MAKQTIKKLFDTVDLHGRSVIIGEKGKYICAIERYKHKVNLYVVGDFYAEIYYRPLTKKIFRIECSDAKSLEKFLPLINLPNLTDS